MKIGVLALQGDFIEHIAILRSIGVDALEVRLPAHLDSLDGLIIPGGESTAIGKLAAAYGLIEPLRDFGVKRAIWGTCAGAILLSDDVHRDQPLLGLMHIQVERNAFGRQVASFETAIDIPALKKVAPQGGPYPAIFIRAPLIEKVGEGVQILAQLEDGRIVAAQQGRLLATSFHPELTDDHRVHQYFVERAREN
ncbi:MAG: pyridoxal 5'-phosphate synthase glutaminase subunit PdxT [Anaerolineae bacterium UTCFX2]|jgi:5'-phosphate synthase pdxT subunit|nr:pyridoxal 5'-phosphate synthase glutaminase subunit PdxT [Anaerolineae bacterium]MCZ7552124.1 pyridoxal 5'-phosphate synthase glutaminase subunit PdxT [Anaerolineales bacterium]OQY93000.1 MAG: pyridoxal 5'-phosphate synthase glutaminase subunit PdxT [Anaerolineae bacterium UTCFX2]